MGTPEFGTPVLEALVKEGHRLVGVVTQPDRPKGRGKKVVFSPIKKAALAFNLEVLQPEKAHDPGFLETVRSMAPDLLIVVAYGQILKKALLDIPRFGALNIHASLLPKYRGAAPIQWAILNNEEKTGLTAMWMEEGLDSGPMILQEEIPIHPEETAGQLHDELSELAGGFIVRVLGELAEGRTKRHEQDESKATYAPKISRDMATIDWRRPAASISAQIRALDPWPGASTTVEGRELRLFSSQVAEGGKASSLRPGMVVGLKGDALQVETAEGMIRIRELQVPGKKRLPAADFLRGFHIPPGAVLGK